MAAQLQLQPGLAERSLSSTQTVSPGTFSPAKNHVILVMGLVCASISLLAAVLALRWFLLMRRSFRHHLILLLIMSDTFKAIWYFVFPVVIFSRGEVDSSAKYCQASGFLLSLGIEASDFAILTIALHAMLYVFQALHRPGDGGLYAYRKYIYPLWVFLPILAASLAFTNPATAYANTGTVCYLPKRPFWYRLALTWIPRYLIFVTIFAMYATTYIYVHIKFRNFGKVESEGHWYSSDSASHALSANETVFEHKWTRESLLATINRQSPSLVPQQTIVAPHPPWKDVEFSTTQPLQNPIKMDNDRIATTDFAPENSSSFTDTRVVSRQMSSQPDANSVRIHARKASEVPTLGTSYTGLTAVTDASTVADRSMQQAGTTRQLGTTRTAIERQMRFLFVYPVVYVLMWTFPLASHCLHYSDWYTAHPPFWLSVVQTCMLALQAGVDCAIFSWKERPWMRADKNSRCSTRSLALRLTSIWERKVGAPTHVSSRQSSISTEADETQSNSHWWEEEGRKRQDSVWLGTDVAD